MNNLKALCFDRLISTLPEYIFWKDIHSKYLGCNDKFAREVGLSTPKEIVGLSDNDLPWKDKFSALYVQEDRYVITSKKNIENKEVPFTDVDGNKRIILINKYPLIVNNQVKGLIGIFIDITEEKRAELLEFKNAESEKKAKYMSMAAGTIAHDLRTPLSSVRFAINALENFFPHLLDAYKLAKQNEMEVHPIRNSKLKILETVLTRCQNEIDFAQNYIDMILGNLKFESINTDNYDLYPIAKIVNASLESYPYQPGEQEILHWQPKIDFEFWGNDFYLKNVLNNLLKNSYYYIKKNERGEIYITTDETESHYLLKFKDTAQGAPPEILEHMFDGYFSKREGGTGLGLAFCKNIMLSFGGDIKVESVEGEFIEFTLLFPKTSHE